MEENLFLVTNAIAKAIKDKISSSTYKSLYLDEVTFGTVDAPLDENLELLINSLVKNKETASRLPTIRVTHSQTIDFASSINKSVLGTAHNEIVLKDVYSDIEIPYSGADYKVRLKVQVIIISREFASSIKLQTLVYTALKSLGIINYPITMMNKTTNKTLFYCENCGEVRIFGEIENDGQRDRELGIFVNYFTFDVEANVFSLEEIARYAGADDIDNYCLSQAKLLEDSRGVC